MQLALQNGNAETVKILLQYGAAVGTDETVKSVQGSSTSANSLRNGRVRLSLSKLRPCDRAPTTSTLHFAARNSGLNCVKALVEHLEKEEMRASKLREVQVIADAGPATESDIKPNPFR